MPLHDLVWNFLVDSFFLFEKEEAKYNLSSCFFLEKLMGYHSKEASVASVDIGSGICEDF